jgi:hypothetical protein
MKYGETRIEQYQAESLIPVSPVPDFCVGFVTYLTPLYSASADVPLTALLDIQPDPQTTATVHFDSIDLH